MSNQLELNRQLFEAAEKNQIHTVVELVRDKGVDVDEIDENRDNYTALHYATINGYFDLIKVLVEELNADIDITSVGGEAPIHMAANEFSRNLDILRYFIARGSIYQEDVQDVLDEYNRIGA